MRALAAAKIPTVVMVAPIIPGLTDHETEAIMEAAADAGAWHASYTLLRMPHEIKDLFRNWLLHHEPLKAERVISLLRQCRGGRLNDPRFGHRMRGEGAYAELIARRFRIARRRLGLDREIPALERTFSRSPAINCDCCRRRKISGEHRHG